MRKEKPVAWTPKDLMDVKREFVELAFQEGVNRRELCRRFGISPKTGYALLARYALEGAAACTPRSRRPLSSPTRTSPETEQAVIALRSQHPAWGGRKIARRLADLGMDPAPPPSTITAILYRHGLNSLGATVAAQHWQRFEHDVPNSLWQIDFKGYFETAGGKCHPLTLLDDPSRFSLALQACARPDTLSVRGHLTNVFEHDGLALRINADNGGPWAARARPVIP